MIVGIDGNEANIKERVGVHQYAFEIIWALYKLQDIKSEGIQFIVYLKKPPMSDLPKENDYWKYKVINISYQTSAIDLQIQIHNPNRPAIWINNLPDTLQARTKRLVDLMETIVGKNVKN